MELVRNIFACIGMLSVVLTVGISIFCLFEINKTRKESEAIARDEKTKGKFTSV